MSRIFQPMTDLSCDCVLDFGALGKRLATIHYDFNGEYPEATAVEVDFAGYERNSTSFSNVMGDLTPNAIDQINDAIRSDWHGE